MYFNNNNNEFIINFNNIQIKFLIYYYYIINELKFIKWEIEN